MSVVDVGASYGYTTCLFAHAVGPLGSVLAVEPAARSYMLLAANVHDNGYVNVTPERVAVTCEPGTVRLHLDREYVGCHSLFADNLVVPGEQECVYGVTLDQLLAYHDVERVDLLKIDVEGAEGLVLQGAAATLARTESLWIEYWPTGLRAAGTDPEQVLHRIVDAGFGLRLVELVTGESVDRVSPADVVAYCEGLRQRAVLQDDPQGDVLYDLVYLLGTRDSRPGRSRGLRLTRR
jgi:FkbM family methyltransferase